MRQPSTPAQRWQWWERAVAGDPLPLHEDEPQAGFYSVRKFRYGDWPTGPRVPARIWWEPGEIDPETGELLTDERLLGEVDGKPINPWNQWTWIARNPIPETDWKWLKALSPLLPTKPPPRRA